MQEVYEVVLFNEPPALPVALIADSDAVKVLTKVVYAAVKGLLIRQSMEAPPFQL